MAAEMTADAAFVEGVLREHGGILFAFCLRFTGDRQRAEDAVQEVLVRARRQVDSLELGERSLRPWLLTCARNLLTDAHRASSSRPVLVHDDDAMAAAGNTENAIDRAVESDDGRGVAAALRRASPGPGGVFLDGPLGQRSCPGVGCSCRNGEIAHLLRDAGAPVGVDRDGGRAMIDHTQAQLSLGAYVLGALDAGDRSELEEHLAGCADCRRELVSFAGLPGLMGRLSLTEVQQQEPTPSAALQVSTLAAIQSEQDSFRRTVRRWRVVAGGGLAAAVAACVALILVLTSSGPAVVDAATVRRDLTAATGVSSRGSLSLLSKPWGTQVHLVLSDLPRTGAFSVRTIDDEGRQSTAATWQATQNGQAELTGATPSRIDDIDRVEIVTDTGITVLSNR